ncbi:MAG: hypothetical protein IPM02_28010 [Betaproteobacteria bacterium]|nr:hypothetical protein [Betaproteobacteria bacterium]
MGVIVNVWFAPLFTMTEPVGEIEPFAPADAVIVNVVGGIAENVAGDREVSRDVCEGIARERTLRDTIDKNAGNLIAAVPE